MWQCAASVPDLYFLRQPEGQGELYQNRARSCGAWVTCKIASAVAGVMGQRLCVASAPTAERKFRNLSLAKGMKTLREDGWAKVFKGVTSVKEILRVAEEQ